MADILTVVLKQYSRESKDLKLPPLSDYTSCVVVGECDNLRKSLLFLTALTAASELGLKVLFLSPAPIESLPGVLQSALARLSPDDLKKIKFKYPRCSAELRCEIAALHELAAPPPSLIIVDGMDLYLGAEDGLLAKQAQTAHISALLLDTAAFLTQRLEGNGDAAAPCYVITSFRPEQEGRTAGESSAPDPVLAVIDRYFPVRCTFTKGEGTSSSLECATEIKETLKIYFSGVGLNAASPLIKTHETRFGQQWSLSVAQDGAMEFSVQRVKD
ncbi:ATPase SWSAP1 [Brienomyrus brachyistius]|uniref:ATPase SWSAP1 n=1 Tax=Brienomyrus brachyistius TaxID=42636 RepID=UPI0020B3CCDD|nr:ATPase SWSAP1 [Brienomyrus brachyistius]